MAGQGGVGGGIDVVGAVSQDGFGNVKGEGIDGRLGPG